MFNKTKQAVCYLWNSEVGQDTVEYALLLTLLSLAAIAALSTLAGAINNAFTGVAANLSNAT